MVWLSAALALNPTADPVADGSLCTKTWLSKGCSSDFSLTRDRSSHSELSPSFPLPGDAALSHVTVVVIYSLTKAANESSRL